MEPTSYLLEKKRWAFLPLTINLLFYGSILCIIAISNLPSIKESVFLMRKQFLKGNEAFFKIQEPGRSFSVFEPYCPKKGAVSFLMDEPYTSEHTASEPIQSAQGWLAPLVLNPDPVENTAFVFCSQNVIAAHRMQTTGYNPIKILGNGKMIAEKRS